MPDANYLAITEASQRFLLFLPVPLTCSAHVRITAILVGKYLEAAVGIMFWIFWGPITRKKPRNHALPIMVRLPLALVASIFVNSWFMCRFRVQL